MSWNLKEKADRLLSQESGTIRKDWGGRVSFALVYPNTYAVGMSNLGFQTIYRHLNALPDVVCERAFLPDPEDLPEYQRTGTAPFSLESKRHLREFDLVGFSITYEGDYINTLRLMRMAGIPSRPENRRPEDPIVLMGGVCAFADPEPVAHDHDRAPERPVHAGSRSHACAAAHRPALSSNHFTSAWWRNQVRWRFA